MNGGIQLKESDYAGERLRMVELLSSRGIVDPLVLQAMGRVRRHLFFPSGINILSDPYGDYPQEIGFGQTISQPYIVAYMIEKLHLKPADRVLEIGTGSGYQAAVLCEAGMKVFTVELVPELCSHAGEVLPRSVHLRCGDGDEGWPEEAPFNGIVLSCSPESVPQKLVDQLAEGGRMILPVGGFFQKLVIVEKKAGSVSIYDDLPVRFVPMLKPAR